MSTSWGSPSTGCAGKFEQLMAQGDGLGQIYAHRTLRILAQTAQGDGLCLRSSVPCLIGIPGRHGTR